MALLVDNKPVSEKIETIDHGYGASEKIGMVTIPFETEFAVRFRNKNSRRALVKLFIDGENVSAGGYVINANGYIDIERHAEIAKRFKFVDLDSPDAVEHGKNDPNDNNLKGTIEARFYLEKEQPVVKVIHEHHHHDHYDGWPRPNPWRPRDWPRPYFGSCHLYDGQTKGTTLNSVNLAGAASMDAPVAKGSMLRGLNMVESRRGATVEGSESDQRFVTASFDAEEAFVSVKIHVRGVDAPVEHVKPVNRVGKSETDTQRKLRETEDELNALRLKFAEIEREKLLRQISEAEATAI